MEELENKDLFRKESLGDKGEVFKTITSIKNTS